MHCPESIAQVIANIYAEFKCMTRDLSKHVASQMQIMAAVKCTAQVLLPFLAPNYGRLCVQA